MLHIRVFKWPSHEVFKHLRFCLTTTRSFSSMGYDDSRSELELCIVLFDSTLMKRGWRCDVVTYWKSANNGNVSWEKCVVRTQDNIHDNVDGEITSPSRKDLLSHTYKFSTRHCKLPSRNTMIITQSQDFLI